MTVKVNQCKEPYRATGLYGTKALYIHIIEEYVLSAHTHRLVLSERGIKRIEKSQHAQGARVRENAESSNHKSTHCSLSHTGCAHSAGAAHTTPTVQHCTTPGIPLRARPPSRRARAPRTWRLRSRPAGRTSCCTYAESKACMEAGQRRPSG